VENTVEKQWMQKHFDTIHLKNDRKNSGIREKKDKISCKNFAETLDFYVNWCNNIVSKSGQVCHCAHLGPLQKLILWCATAIPTLQSE
jgi:hypothetical protein